MENRALLIVANSYEDGRSLAVRLHCDYYFTWPDLINKIKSEDETFSMDEDDSAIVLNNYISNFKHGTSVIVLNKEINPEMKPIDNYPDYLNEYIRSSYEQNGDGRWAFNLNP